MFCSLRERFGSGRPLAERAEHDRPSVTPGTPAGMPAIVSIHSYRGGTGKSNVTANLAVSVALTGKRVGIVDTDIQSPGVHILFGLDDKQITRTLNDYLYGQCKVEDTAFCRDLC